MHVGHGGRPLRLAGSGPGLGGSGPGLGGSGPGLGRSPFITPDSSQTESEDVSPQVQRRRRTREPRLTPFSAAQEGGDVG